MSINKSLASLLRRVANKLAPDHSPKMAAGPVNRFLSFAPAGHFYSPVPDPEYIDKNAAELFKREIASLPGIDNNLSKQIELTEQFLKYAADYTPAATALDAKHNGDRFYSDNPFFEELDAYVYCGMLRHYQPRKIVEVGSGHTSALALDVCDRFVKPGPEFVFIDPYPERLRSLLDGRDASHNIVIHESSVQRVDKSIFLQLKAGEFLFVDSSHTSKIGSDVNFLFLEIFPQLAKGVVVHIHDIFWPFEYPRSWLMEGRCWNEAYLLRGMLACSARYKILQFNSQLAELRPEEIKKMPKWVKPGLSSSLWLEVVS